MLKQDYMRLRRDNQRSRLLALLGGKCVRCGTTERLQFDHIDPKTMSFRLGKAFGGKWEKLLGESKKCQLLCKDCHWTKTRLERGLEEPKHGTVNMYNNLKCRCLPCKKAWSTYATPRTRRWRISIKTDIIE